MQVILEVTHGNGVGARRTFPPGEYLFGRGEGSDVLFDKSSSVSRRHCLLCVTETAVSVRDLRSRNGTVVNGKRVSECALRHGDRLYVGGTEFRVEINVAHDRGAPDPGLDDRTLEMGSSEFVSPYRGES